MKLNGIILYKIFYQIIIFILKERIFINKIYKIYIILIMKSKNIFLNKKFNKKNI